MTTTTTVHVETKNVARSGSAVPVEDMPDTATTRNLLRTKPRPRPSRLANAPSSNDSDIMDANTCRLLAPLDLSTPTSRLLSVIPISTPTRDR